MTENNEVLSEPDYEKAFKTFYWLRNGYALDFIQRKLEVSNQEMYAILVMLVNCGMVKVTPG